MKKLLSICIFFLISSSFASELNLVRIPSPEKDGLIHNSDFVLFHRAGDYWIGSLPLSSPIPKNWENLGKLDFQKGELFRLIFPSIGELNKITGLVKILYQGENEAILQIKPEEMHSLPKIDAQWIHISTCPKPEGFSGVEIPPTDDFHPLVQNYVNEISYNQYLNYLQNLQDFITRNTFTQGCNQSANWILSQFQSFGLDSELDEFIISGSTKYNVVGELIGQVYPDSIVLITGHYDATAGSPFSQEPLTPGADDNGSGVACVLECARILSQYGFENTIRFVAFAGEEQGLYGSEDYVEDILAANEDIVGCFNFDMIAYSGNDPLPPDMVIYADNNPLSIAMAEKVAEAIMTFVPDDIEPDLIANSTMGSSDHGPFWDAGLPAICGIEAPAWSPDFNPYYHSTNDIIANCDIDYAVNCTKAAIAAFADYAGPIVESGPALTIFDYDITEITGNGNGIPDPGETLSISVTLENVGVEPAVNISTVLSSNSPYMTITQNLSGFPNINPGETGASLQDFVIEIDQVCPLAEWVTANLAITAGGGYSSNSLIFMLVADPIYSPTGPDAYGYYAFDYLDIIGTPLYSWIEIDPNAGGPGTLINYTIDDQTVQVDLPFSFSYYGLDYNEISACNNGWISMGTTTSTDYSNSHIPDDDGPPAMIAPFWEDLSPQIIGTVSYYYDSVENYFVIEFNGVRQFSPAWALETFEVILYDPAHHTTPTGDGKIKFQYAEISDPSSCTIGIENETETVGLEYLYNGTYDSHAAPIGNETAVLIMTVDTQPEVIVTLTPAGTPIQIPASGGSFEYNIAGSNNSGNVQNFDVWCNVILPNGSTYGPVMGPFNLNMNPGISINRDRNQSVPANAPAGNYTFKAYAGAYPSVIWSSDEFDFEKLAVGDGIPVSDWNNWGESFDDISGFGDMNIPAKYALHQNYPNPFNPKTSIRFELPSAGAVSLQVFDIQGRVVAELVDEWMQSGVHESVFYAESLSSGIYFARLEAEGFSQTIKLLLLK